MSDIDFDYVTIVSTTASNIKTGLLKNMTVKSLFKGRKWFRGKKKTTEGTEES